jgi:hypothetical protein
VAGLEALRLKGNRVGAPGARALAASPHLVEPCRLSTLDLVGCGLGDAGVASIAAAPWAVGLRRLYLCSTDVGEEGVEAVVRSPLLSGLTLLDFTGNRLTDGDRFALRGRFGMSVWF